MDFTKQQTIIEASTDEQWAGANVIEDVVARKRNRSRYVAKACNECKRRKIKCNGQKPCQRCKNLQVECVYYGNGGRANQESQQLFSKIRSLQEQISTLNATLDDLSTKTLTTSDTVTFHSNGQFPLSHTNKQTQDTPSSVRRWSLASRRRNSFSGPTTSAFSFDVAKSSLKNRGITDLEGIADEADARQEPTPLPSPLSTSHNIGNQPSIDPLRDIKLEEALRLCGVYDEEMGMMYPVLTLEQIVGQVDVLYGRTWARPRVKSSQEYNRNNNFPDDDDVNILRMVFACALTAEGGGQSDLAIRLLSSVKNAAEDRIWGPPGIKGMIFLMLVSILYFQMDEETLAWRIIGIVERMSLELGLHRHETLGKAWVTEIGSERVLKLFWCIYVLDMRWSLGTGMPFALQDTDIDPRLPKPNESTPYLRVMVRYTQIAAKVWKFVNHFNNTGEIKEDDMAYLDWQVLQWANSVPKSLELNAETELGHEYSNRGIRRLQSLLYLRANQLRLLIYRPTLHTAMHVQQYPVEAGKIVDIAKDTIQFVTRLNKTSDIYKLQQVTFNWFLISALAALFLAVAQAPTQFSSQCRDEFYMALELVKDFSTKSYISRRLWRSISSLRKLAPKVGLQKNGTTQAETVTLMNDSTMETITNAFAFENFQDCELSECFPPDGTQMCEELMNWFKAVGDLEGNSMFPLGAVELGTDEQSHRSSEIEQYQIFGNGDELSSIMKDCF